METTLHGARLAATALVTSTPSKPFKLHHIDSWRRRRASLGASDLPPAAAELKERIRSTNGTKYFAFSLLEMKKIATPPVQIPATYRRRATAVVGGRRVPLTRTMWRRRQRQRPHQLPKIVETEDAEPTSTAEARRRRGGRARRRSSCSDYHRGDLQAVDSAMVYVM